MHKKKCLARLSICFETYQHLFFYNEYTRAITDMTKVLKVFGLCFGDFLFKEVAKKLKTSAFINKMFEKK